MTQTKKTHEQYDSIFWDARQKFYIFLQSKQMLYTLALASQITWKWSNLPVFAMFQVTPTPTITISTSLLDMFADSNLLVENGGVKINEAVYSVFMHELRHFIQPWETRFELMDLSPLVNAYQKLASAASNPEAKKLWEGKVEVLVSDKSEEKKKFQQKIINLSSDAALNEDVQQLFPTAIDSLNKYTNDSLPEDKRNESGKYYITVENLNAVWPDPDVPTRTLPTFQSHVQYEITMIDRLARQKSKEDPNNPSEGEKSSGDGVGTNGIDELLKQLDDHAQAGDQREVERILGELRQKVKNQAEKMEARIGSQSADVDIFGNPNEKISQALEHALRKIKIKLVRLIQETEDYEYTYNRKHRKLPGNLPGDTRVIKPQKSLVVVCDTSGSVFSNLLFSKMCAIAKVFYKKKELIGLYACDTELTKINLDKLGSSKVQGVGGGNTVFDVGHITQIRQDIGISDKQTIDVVYITDLMVDLTSIKNDPTVKLHLVDILYEEMK